MRTRPVRRALLAGTLLALAALLAFACSDDDGDKDAAVTGDGGVTEGGADIKPAGDLLELDMDLSKKPEINEIRPNNGFADGGSAGQIKVVMTGKNFAAGAIVFIDGANPIMTVSVNSPVSISFNMPKNPYGEPNYDTPYKASVSVSVNGMISNSVDFQYTVSKPMDDTFKGSVITTSMDSFSDFPSEPIDGKVFLQGVTDTTTGISAQIKAMIGIGPVGNDPSKDPGWMWYDAKFKQDDGTYDLYTSAIEAPLSQTYDLAFRFSKDGGGTWIYADTDETDLAYDTGKAAKLNATDAPVGYCKSDADCALSAWEVVCKVDPVDTLKNICVECLADKDCTDNPKSLGPSCNLDVNMCFCQDDNECPNNPNGAVCVDGYCGCQSHDNCPHPTQCTQTAEGMTICK